MIAAAIASIVGEGAWLEGWPRGATWAEMGPVGIYCPSNVLPPEPPLCWAATADEIMVGVAGLRWGFEPLGCITGGGRAGATNGGGVGVERLMQPSVSQRRDRTQTQRQGSSGLRALRVRGPRAG